MSLFVSTSPFFPNLYVLACNSLGSTKQGVAPGERRVLARMHSIGMDAVGGSLFELQSIVVSGSCTFVGLLLWTDRIESFLLALLRQGFGHGFI